jgi:hypothetical protein
MSPPLIWIMPAVIAGFFLPFSRLFVFLQRPRAPQAPPVLTQGIDPAYNFPSADLIKPIKPSLRAPGSSPTINTAKAAQAINPDSQCRPGFFISLIFISG